MSTGYLYNLTQAFLLVICVKKTFKSSSVSHVSEEARHKGDLCIWCTELAAYTWDYSDGRMGESHYRVEGVFAVKILSPDVIVHTDTHSIHAALGTHICLSTPVVWCWLLFEGKTKIKKKKKKLLPVFNKLTCNSNLPKVLAVPVGS